MIHKKYFELKKKQDKLLAQKNQIDKSFYNGIYNRYKNPILTRDHIPLTWKFDLNAKNKSLFFRTTWRKCGYEQWRNLFEWKISFSLSS